MKKSLIWSLAALLAAPLSSRVLAQQLENAQKQASQGVRAIADDNGAWGGSGDNGTTHQNGANDWIEKTLIIPPGALQNVKEARLRVLMAVMDYSDGGDATKPNNGLDESFDVLVNGQARTYRTSEGFPGRPSPGAPLQWQWHDFSVPVAQLKEGENTFLFRKSADSKGADYLYIGIDNSIERGRSRKSEDGGQTWSNTSLNATGARGEYMMRLLLLQDDMKSAALWTPQNTDDGHNIFGYAGREENGAVRLEMNAAKLDRAAPSRLIVEYSGNAPQVLAPNYALPAPDLSTQGRAVYTLPMGGAPRLLEIVPQNGAITSVRYEYGRDPLPSAESAGVNLAPKVLAARGKAAKRAAAARLTADGFILENALLQAQFVTKPSLQMKSLRHELLARDILAQPQLTKLFLLETDGQRFGAADWQVNSVALNKPAKAGAALTGVIISLALPQKNLSATLRLSATASALRFGLDVKNSGTASRSWKTAFPHLAGVQLSPNSDDDHYLFPYKGGIIGPLDANLRSAYGEDQAWWQMISLFSPGGGAGVFLRADDRDGLYKAASLRKGRAPRSGTKLTAIGTATAPELLWSDALESAPGTAMTFEYLSRTREAGKSFAPPDAVLEAHSGDWKTALREYSGWAHRAWKWRRFSPRLDDVWNIGTIGWGANRIIGDGSFFQPAIFRDGKFRTDYLDANNDAIEPHGWWEWSRRGPWGAPLRPVEAARATLGEPFWAFINSYMGTDGASEEIGYSQNMGDYDYHASWGGLPAFRAHLADLKKRGFEPMLYTCPPLVDFNSRMGQQYGARFGVVNRLLPRGPLFAKNTPEGYIGSFGSYNMCFDNAEYPPIVAAQMARILRDTGASGLRMDVLGHPNYACANPLHKHLYAEPGHNEYLRGSQRFAALTRAAVDKAAPGSALTSEFPGYDFMVRHLDGVLVYESSWNISQIRTLRPVPVNLLRFYFPEIKTFDLDELEPAARVAGSEAFRFWNGMAAFGITHAPRYHRVLKENGDAFNDFDAQPLIETLRQQVYANGFSSGAKTLFTLINATGFTVNEPLLALNAKPDERLFDVLRGREITLQKGEISMRLRPLEAACIARFSRVLARPQRAPGGWKITLANTTKAPRRLALCDGEGATLLSTQVPPGATRIALAHRERATHIKLFGGNYLLDAMELK